jgi:uncharacterized protein (TIGR03435 family)
VSPLAQAVSAALIHFIWQGVLVGVLLSVALAVLRGRSPAARYLVSCAALAVLVVAPAATALLALFRAVPPDVRAASMVTNLRALIVPQPMLSIWMNPEVPSALWLAQVQLWALPVWSAGVLLFSLRLVWGCTQALALGRGGEPADHSMCAIVAAVAARMGVKRPVRVRISTLVDGPSVLGWLRPLMLLTPAAAIGLTPAQLEAVIAHELAHIKRWDYLVNVFQIVAETLFFYHPAVWWMSHRIRVERELCCDDLAIRACGDPVCYARALTVLERQRIEVPALAMGIASGALLHRIQRLLGASTQESAPSRWPAVLALGIGVTCTSARLDWNRLLAQTGADSLQFEVTSIKPHKSGDAAWGIMGQPGGRFTATNVTLRTLILNSYQLQDDQIVGGPSWLGSDHFDIVAKGEENLARDRPPRGQGPGDMQLMVRALLADRFKLTMHKETRELPIYALVMARSDNKLGSQLRLAAVDCQALAAARARGGPGDPGAPGGADRPGRDPGSPIASTPGGRTPCGMRISGGTVVAGGSRISQLALVLSTWVHRSVVDKTGLTGSYDIDLQWTPDQLPWGLGGDPSAVALPPPLDPDRPSIFTALQEQLGFRLEAQKGPVEVLVIDQVGPPTED